MRIVAGRFRGRAIAAPVALGTRPTSDRVREALFNILAHGAAAVEFEGVRVIDLFAGTGALGLEAISRGAAFALFVEEEPAARAAIRENVEAFGLIGETRIFRRDATSLGPIGTMAPFSLAFLDPPYGQGLGERALASLIEGNWLMAGAIVTIEERRGVKLALPPGCCAFDQREYGDTAVTFVRVGTASG